jgi:hypothetical protein
MLRYFSRVGNFGWRRRLEETSMPLHFGQMAEDATKLILTTLSKVLPNLPRLVARGFTAGRAVSSSHPHNWPQPSEAIR